MNSPGNSVAKERNSHLFDLISSISEKVVSRYVARSVIPKREKDDVIMSVIERFIKKKERIDKAFEGKSKLSTYYTAVINRICCEVIRKEQRQWYAVGDHTLDIQQDNHFTSHTFESLKEFVIKEEVQRLSNIILFFNQTSAKVNLFLKYYFDIPLKDRDFRLYCNGHSATLKEILANRESLSKTEVFQKLSYVTNMVENKNIGKDAVRIWFDKQLDTILKRMNANGLYYYNKESLAVLLEMEEYYKNTSDCFTAGSTF